MTDDLDEAVPRSLVLHGLSGSHHHSPTDGVNGVGDEAGSDSDNVAQHKRYGNAGVLPQQQRLETVVESEVAASVDDDPDTGDNETPVEPHETVRLEGLGVDVDEPVELSLSTTFSRCLGIVGETGSGVVQRVHEAEREGTGCAARRDVFRERDDVGVRFAGLEESLDLVLEGKVEGLRGEVSDAVGQVSSPEW